MSNVTRPIRCAIYTRKSNEEGLEQEFNSLHAQRETGEAFILSQKHEGWTVVDDHYDDGGYSGGDMERPALKRLMRDIEKGLIDVVIVYKIDRLSRAIVDFGKLLEMFDQHDVSFVSVTQQFNSKTAMGRLFMNIMFGFAQFEREVSGERIRDKFSASKSKGMWMGGFPPLGYDVADRKLIINKDEELTVKYIFNRFLTLKSATLLAQELRQKGVRTKSYTTAKGKHREGTLVNKHFIYKILINPIYIGKIRHKDKIYDGQHKAIIDEELWNEVRDNMQESPRTRAKRTVTQTPALLKGLVVCGGCQSCMSCVSTRRRGKLYRYYIGNKHIKNEDDNCPIGRVPASELEHVVLSKIKPFMQTPEVLVQTWKAVKLHMPNITEKEIRLALQNFDIIWRQLFPAEQQRILELLIQKIEVYPDRVDIKLRVDGIGRMTQDLMQIPHQETMAA